MKGFINFFAVFFFVVILGLSLSGCDSGDDTKDLESQTINFEVPADGNGDFQFYTNEEEYYSYEFATRKENPSADPDTYQVAINKRSGNASYGYGMIFCVSSDSSLSESEYYRLLITINGNYQVAKRSITADKSEEYKVIIPFESDFLAPGYKQYNALRVKKTGNSFEIFFNDHYELKFTDESPLSGNGMGFIAYVGKEEEENFPNQPVDIRYLWVKD